MIIQWTDFNGADGLIKRDFAKEWRDTKAILEALPLQLKPSDQAGKQGQPIFDPVATNLQLKAGLCRCGWTPNLAIPGDLAFLGKDVDFFSGGMLLEAQFSNYPFLLNNIIRSALLIKAGTSLENRPVRAIMVIAKSHMLPASNSVLYYEQGVKQLSAFFGRFAMLEVPVRLIGLFAQAGAKTSAVWNEYPGRYSRAASTSKATTCKLMNHGRPDAICRIELA